MRKILIIAVLTGIWGIATADTEDYVKGRVILIKSDIAYIDVGQKDGVASGQSFELYYGQQVVSVGKIAWADQNISRSEPLDSTLADRIQYFYGSAGMEPLIAKIRFLVTRTGGGGFLNIAYFSDLNLEPASISTPEDMMVARLIHRGLLTKDRSGQFQPDLCADYEIRDLTYTFYINPNARFHSGKSVEADDIAYSLEQLARAPRLTSASSFVLEINGALDFRNGIKGEISGVFIIDSRTIAITLKRPFPAFEDYLAGPAGYINPRPGEVSTGLSIIGAGPYRMKWIDPAGLALVPDSSGGQVGYLDSLRFIRFANPEEAGLAFELGKIDMISLLGEPPPKFAARGNYQTQGNETDAYVVLGINNGRGYQAGQDFGKALSFLFDRNSIIRVILGGSASLPEMEISNPGDQSIPLYDPQTADSASYYFHKVYSMPKNLTLYIDSSYPIMGKVARYIEGQLQNCGIKIKEKRVNLGQLTEPQNNSDIDLYLTTYLPVSNDPECIFYPLLSESLSGQTNFLFYSDEANQALLDSLGTMTNPDSSQSLAGELAQSIASHPPLVFLYRPNLVIYSKSHFSGIIIDKAGYPDLRKAYIEANK